MKKTATGIALMLMAASLCVLSGCSDVNRDGTLKPAKGYETIDFNDISFKLRDDFQKYESEEFDGWQGDVYLYKGSKQFVLTFMTGNAKMPTTPEVLLEYHDIILYHDVKEKDKKKEILNGENYDIAYITKDISDEKNKNEKIADFEIPVANGSFVVTIGYPEKEEKLARALGIEIMDSVVYNGDFTPRTGSKKLDYDFFTIDLDETFTDEGVRNNSETGVTLRHAYVDKMSKFLSSTSISYSAQNYYDSAEEWAKAECDKVYSGKNSKKFLFTEEPHEAEILGYDAWKSVYEYTPFDYLGTYKKINYYFDHDGIMFSVSQSIHMSDGWEEVQENMDELLKSVHFRDVTDEEREAYEAAKTRECETENFTFVLPGYFQDNELTGGYSGPDISISFDEMYYDPELSLKDAAEKLRRDKRYYIERDATANIRQIGERDFGCVILDYYIDDEENMFIEDKEYFIYEENGRRLLIEASFHIDDVDETFQNKTLMDILSSIRAK